MVNNNNNNNDNIMRRVILLANGIVGKVQMFFFNFRYWICKI